MADLLFKSHRIELMPALEAAIEAVARKDTIPILMNVLLKPQAGRLLVRGTDLDTEVETDCDLLATGSGEAITVHAKALYDIVRNAPESAEIIFTAGKHAGQISIAAGRSRYALNVLPESDFPSMGDTSPPESFSISAPRLSEAFAKISYAIERSDKTRYYLMGAFLTLSTTSTLEVVGCDGKSLAVARIALEGANPFPGALVPLKSVTTFRKLFAERKTPCTVSISDVKIVFKCDGMTFTSKLIDGRFPDYPRIIPKPDDNVVIADRAEVRAAIARTCIVSSDTSREALKLIIAENTMQLQLLTRDGEGATESVNIKYGGPPYEKGFNGSFLASMLASITTPEFRMCGTDPQSPGHFAPNDDSTEEYVLMPMKVG